MMFVLAISNFAFGQNTIELTFTGDNNGQYLPIDSICIKNLTNGDAATLYPGDTTLILVITGLNDPGKNSSGNFTIFQNSPNPFNRQTTIKVFIPNDRLITFEVTNLLGAKLATLQTVLQRGFHNFSFNSGREKIYFLTLHYNGTAKTIKMINSGISDQNCSLIYSGPAEFRQNQKSSNLFTELDFTPGDELLMIGYSGGVESGFIDSPETSRQYVIQFARNVACPGLDSLLYADIWYHTIQVLGQCWLKENLDVGMMINGTQTQTNNGIIEKYCYGNNANNCNSEGGLYLWDEIMQYSTTSGARGICPEGWHIPTDNEFKVLEGVADSYYKIGASIWDNDGLRGTDAGKNLKSSTGWTSNGNGVDAFGFRVLPGGYWWQNGFFDRTVGAVLWTSSLKQAQNAYYRGLASPGNGIVRTTFNQPLGMSVRCLKDL
jgi:uncharacterized protein (TIGR02145 family)